MRKVTSDLTPLCLVLSLLQQHTAYPGSPQRTNIYWRGKKAHFDVHLTWVICVQLREMTAQLTWSIFSKCFQCQDLEDFDIKLWCWVSSQHECASHCLWTFSQSLWLTSGFMNVQVTPSRSSHSMQMSGQDVYASHSNWTSGQMNVQVTLFRCLVKMNMQVTGEWTSSQ